MKRYVIIAGVNGAGKSTLYQININFKDVPNADEIVREFRDYKNGKLVRISHTVPEWFSKVEI